MELAFRKLNSMVSEETILNYLDYKNMFNVHTDTSDDHLGAFISQHDKSIDFFLRKLSNPHRNYTTT